MRSGRKGILKGKGGMEFDVVPVAVFQRLCKASWASSDFVDISDLIKELRIVKSPFEIEQVRRSGAHLRRDLRRKRRAS